MEKYRPWLTFGNDKLGDVWKFSLTTGLPHEGGTCPGATAWCDHCYATKGRYTFPNVQERRRTNLERLVAPGGMERFRTEVPKEIRSRAIHLVRIHDSGDFYSVDYVAAWASIVARARHTRFWAYTRSWSLADLREALEELRALPNMQLFASVDPTTTRQPPAGWRVAKLKGMMGPLGDLRALTCPVDAGVQDSCAACTYCFIQVPPTSATFGNVAFVPKHVRELINGRN